MLSCSKFQCGFCTVSNNEDQNVSQSAKSHVPQGKDFISHSILQYFPFVYCIKKSAFCFQCLRVITRFALPRKCCRRHFKKCFLEEICVMSDTVHVDRTVFVYCSKCSNAANDGCHFCNSASVNTIGF